VPAVGESSLGFYYRVVCLDSVSYAWFNAVITDNTTQSSYTVVANTCSNNGTWSLAEYPLTNLAGHTITVTFTNHDDNYPGDPIYTLVDAVTIALDRTARGQIVNLDFETGSLSGWASTGATTATQDGAVNGRYHALIGSSSPSTESTLAQTFTMPAWGVNDLSFRYRMECPDTVAYDWFTVSLRDEITQQTYTVLSNICAVNRGWNVVHYPLPPGVPGHPVTLTFTNHDDDYDGDATFTEVDDVMLELAPTTLNAVF